MKIALISVLDENNGIGKDNKLLCYLPADLKRFKKLTSGHSIIMGRKTFESLPNGPLPNRKNIILTRNKDYSASGTEIAHSIEDINNICKNDEFVFVIGGEEIYKIFLPKADYLYITRTHHKFDADAFFPEFSNINWKLIKEEKNLPDEKNKFPYSFLDYKRKKEQ